MKGRQEKKRKKEKKRGARREREGRGKWFKVKERRKGTSGRKRTKTFFFVNTVT